MKKKLNFWLMAALVCGLSMSIASCKDDDKNENGNSESGQSDEQIEKDMADAAVFWDVVGQLTDTPMPDDWKNAKYEPAIGQPDGTNSAIRIVNCADAETAAARAADLLGANITESTQDYTYQNDVVGTLTYHKTSGSSLATVDVSIKQMPGLSQIIYKTPEQMGQNESFSGSAYYRFGDVVTKTNADGGTDYWICVRPAFGPAGKGDSHWISVSKLPEENIKKIAEKRIGDLRLNHRLPQNLSKSNEHMQNLAELLYAMTNPTDWSENLRVDKGYKKLKYFGDFTYEKRYKFFNNDVFERAAEGWDNMNLFKEMFGLTRQELKQHLEKYGLSLVTGTGTISGNDITLPIVKFEGTNLKTKKEFKSTGRWDKGSFVINDLLQKGYIDNSLVVTGGGDRYWVCRYATGATMAQGNEAGGFDKYKKLPNCTDMFVYNRDVDHLNMGNLKDLGPYEGGFVGRPHYLPCDIYKDEKGNRWFVGLPSGIKWKTVAGNVGLDADPYSYLFSFEGITYTSDKKRATNLPSRDEAFKALVILETLSKNAAANCPTPEQLQHQAENQAGSYYKCILNLYDKMGFFIVSPWLGVYPQSGNGEHTVWLTSIAYNDDNDPDQKLLRYIENPDRDQRVPDFYLWEHYPSAPSATGWYPESFSDLPIYLKDIANYDWVNMYAEDAYARSPIHSMTGGDNVTKRQPRSTTDSRATNVTNYFFKKDTWLNRTYPTDMWNEPVVFMRVTRVYDRGEAEFSKKTVDGHTLTLYQQCAHYKAYDASGDRWNPQEPDPEDPYANWYVIFTQIYNEALDDLHIDGKKFRMPSWRDSYYGK
jgi:hypothetical protein